MADLDEHDRFVVAHRHSKSFQVGSLIGDPSDALRFAREWAEQGATGSQPKGELFDIDRSA